MYKGVALHMQQCVVKVWPWFYSFLKSEFSVSSISLSLKVYWEFDEVSFTEYADAAYA